MAGGGGRGGNRSGGLLSRARPGGAQDVKKARDREGEREGGRIVTFWAAPLMGKMETRTVTVGSGQHAAGRGQLDGSFARVYMVSWQSGCLGNQFHVFGSPDEPCAVKVGEMVFTAPYPKRFFLLSRLPSGRAFRGTDS